MSGDQLQESVRNGIQIGVMQHMLNAGIARMGAYMGEEICI